MTIEQNIADRQSAESLFKSMLEVTRDDFLKLSNHGRLCFFQTAFDHFNKRLQAANGTPEPKPQHKSEVYFVTGEARKAIEELGRICDMCDDIPDRGIDFAQSVSQSALDMIDTIEKSQRVTSDQQRAINNWMEGVSKWIR